MSKEYRDMTSEERLRLIQATFSHDALNELEEIIKELKIKLAINEPSMVTDKKTNVKEVHITDKEIEPIRDTINAGGLAGFANVQNDNNNEHGLIKHNISGNIDLKQGSIYAVEHREKAMIENRINSTAISDDLEQHRTRVLEKVDSTPNPWGDAKIVTPGQLKL